MALSAVAISGITGLFGKLFEFLDDRKLSGEERLEFKTKLIGLQLESMRSILDFERAELAAKSEIIVAEAKGESWVQRSWRPVTMLTFVALVVARWLGLTADTVGPELELQLMSLIKIGLGGYVAGRSIEKVAKTVDIKGILQANKEKDE